MEQCAHLLVAEPDTLRGKWCSEFGLSDLHVELGCGKGRFTVDSAKASPDTLFVAFERIDNVMVLALERAAAQSQANVKFVCADAGRITDFFAPGEVSRIYINFCDPWPLRRKAKHRLTNRVFLSLYKQVLAPGGEIRLKTDNLPLFEFSLNEFEQSGFSMLETVYDLHKEGPVGIMTDYEMKFHDQGLAIHSARWAAGQSQGAT